MISWPHWIKQIRGNFVHFFLFSSLTNKQSYETNDTSVTGSVPPKVPLLLISVSHFPLLCVRAINGSIQGVDSPCLSCSIAAGEQEDRLREVFQGNKKLIDFILQSKRKNNLLHIIKKTVKKQYIYVITYISRGIFKQITFQIKLQEGIDDSHPEIFISFHMQLVS